MAHDAFLSHLDGLSYYGSAALFDLLAIILMSGIRPVPVMVVRLQRICVASIALNAAGWVLWASYFPPLAYDLLFICVYLWALITLLLRDSAHDVGGYTMDRWRSCVCFNRPAWVGYILKDGAKT